MMRGLFSIFILTFPIIVYSQSYLSPILGTSSSYNNGVGSFADRPNIGYNLGFEIGEDWENRLGVAFDMQFAQKTFNQELGNSNYLKYNFNYVVPSLFLKYKFLETKNCKYVVKGGPFLGFWMSGNSVLIFNNEKTKSTLAFSDRYSKLNYGVNAAVSVIIKRIWIESRIGFGLMDMELKNNSISNLNSIEILLGYRILN